MEEMQERGRSRGEEEPSHVTHVDQQCSKVLLPNLSPSLGGGLPNLLQTVFAKY